MKNKIKIMQVVHSMNVAGAEKLVDSIVRNLNGSEFSFSICCLDSIGPLGEQLIKDGFDVFCLNRKPGVDFGLIRRFAGILKEKQTNILHAHQYTPYFYAASAAIFGNRPKVVFTEHGRHQPDKIRPKRLIYNKILSRFTDRITGVCGFSKDSLIRYEKMPAGKIDVIYNGINYKNFDVFVDRDKKRKELGVGENDVVVGMVGRFSPIKNHKMLLEAFGRVVKEAPNAKLLLAGDGPLKENSQSAIRNSQLKDKVIFLGLRMDIPEILKALDIYVLPSIAEAASLTLLEAMAAGLPVAATRAGGDAEIVINNKTGILVSPDDPNGFAGAIIYLIQNPGEAKAMGKAGRERVEREFNIDKMLNEYRELYQKL